MSALTEALKTLETGKRGSGKTYRMLQHALSTARQGRTVYVMGWDVAAVRILMHHLQGLKEFKELANTPHISYHSGDIQLPNPMGQIRFRSVQHDLWDWNELRFKGDPAGVPTYVDHDVYERKLVEMEAEDKKRAKEAKK